MRNRSKKIAVALIIISIVISATYSIVKRNKQDKIAANLNNKEVSMPYINPAWEEYMELSEEEKQEVEIVPEKYIYKYVPTDNMYGDYSSLPARYTLRDEYPTTIYDQHGEGLCWSYATTTMLESNLKRTQSIDSNFSQKQLDMLTISRNKYLNNYNPYDMSRISAGNGMAVEVQSIYDNVLLAAGIAPVLDSKYNYVENENIDISKVIDKKNIDYTITNTVTFPEYENTDEYKNMLKSFIMRYGAVKFSTFWPTDQPRDCYEISEMSEEVSGHFLSMVGWDDEYVFANGKIGAWIIQNSWYNDHGENMYYYSYDLPSDMIGTIMGVKTLVNKDWDNVYNYSMEPTVKVSGLEIRQDNLISGSSSLYLLRAFNKKAVLGQITTTYSKSSSSNEKLNMVNFVSASQGSTYKISISPDGNDNNFQYEKTLETDMPGIYTVKFDDEILLNNDTFSIKVETNDGAFYEFLNAFTNDVGQSDTDEQIRIESNYNLIGKNRDYNYSYAISSYTNSIPNGSALSYEVYDEDNNRISDLIEPTVSVIDGKATNTISFPTTTALGKKYTVIIKYENQYDNQTVSNELEIIYNPDVYLGNMEGSGTEESPYEIRNAEQLSLISELPSAHYKLMNDIDLSMNKDIEQTYNHGTGWVPLKTFSGVLDGNGHVVKNLTIDSETLDYYIGFFEQLDSATIKNIKFENADINVVTTDNKNGLYRDIGIVVGAATNSIIDNVMVTGNIKTAKDKNTFAGMIVGRDLLDNKYKNIVAIGNIDSGKAGFIAGEGPVNLEKAVINVNVDAETKNNTFNIYNSRHGTDYVRLRYSNIYIIGKQQSITEEELNWDAFSSGWGRKIYIYNENLVDIELSLATPNVDDIKNISLEKNGFGEEIWEYIDGNPYPTQKMFPFSYVQSINTAKTVKLEIGESKNINATVLPNNAFCKDLIYETSDESVATVDSNGTITGVDEGIGTIIVTAMDGSGTKTEIQVAVGNVLLPYEIHTYNHDDTKKTISNIYPATIEHYKENLAIDEPYVVKVFDGMMEVVDGDIATGMTTKIYLDEELVGEYTNIVPGDVYADGKVNSRDAGMIQQYLVGMLDDLYETPQYYAMDFSRDSKVRLNDVELIKRYVIKEYQPTEEDYYGEND